MSLPVPLGREARAVVDMGAGFGIIIGIVLIAIGIILGGGEISSYLDPSSALIVLGGVAASTLVRYRPSELRTLWRITRIAFSRKETSPRDVISLIVRLADKARREGLLAMEDDAEEIEDEFLRKGIQLVVDGADPELVKNILAIEIACLEERHRKGHGMFQFMAAVSPAYGMVGTIIGLIIMLSNLSDPSQLGPAMAVALITTFYGIILANLVFLPLAGKLRLRSQEEVLIKEIMTEGILSIQQGENPRIIEEKLMSFLAPAQRAPVYDPLGAGRSRQEETEAVSFGAR